jgi:dihydroorotate dehydrogenase
MIYRRLLRPLLFRLPPETAHELALDTLRFLPTGTVKSVSTPVRRFGLEFKNPVGLAAGFDKNGVAVDALARMGFGFIEVGTVTNQPQTGNPKPRIFRLPSDRALINRLGFNNQGAEQVAANLRRSKRNCVIGVNIGKSRSVPIDEAIADYLASFEKIYQVADYVAINVSSPNTPNLRELQAPDRLKELINALQERNRELAGEGIRKPLLLKIAPDLTDKEIESIVEVALTTQIVGIIATNTTISRDGLQTPPASIQSYGEGGLSGAPLRKKSTDIISRAYAVSRGKLPIIGVGGVFTAEDTWEKIRAGAGLIQLYTGFIYEGPRIARRVNEGLDAILKRERFDSIDEAIGSGVAI